MNKDPSGDTELPEELRTIEQTLRKIRFEPRDSFAAELAGRLRRRERPGLSGGRGFRSWWTRPLLAGLAGLLALVWIIPEKRITVDRCCYDLDGGGIADDGALVVGERDGRVFRLSLYEDQDGSGNFTSPDILRYDRLGSPAVDQMALVGQTRIQHCCQDLDGGGPADDGIIVLTTPPDRVHTAAIYELR